MRKMIVAGLFAVFAGSAQASIISQTPTQISVSHGFTLFDFAGIDGSVIHVAWFTEEQHDEFDLTGYQTGPSDDGLFHTIPPLPPTLTLPPTPDIPGTVIVPPPSNPTVSTVPVPASLPLFGLAVLMLFGLVIKRRFA